MLERLPAPLACAAWIAGATPDWARFLRALHDPARTQSRKLAALLGPNTAFAREHDFAALRTVRDFQHAVPVRDYDALAPWIARMLDGEPGVLTSERVLMFEKTSGSSGAAKYIPFTASLRREFQAAVRAWMCDLHFHRPALFDGPAYWCITPIARERETTRGGLPVGFESDAEYFAPREQRLLAALMAVPGAVARAPSVEAALYATLRHLLQQPGLRFISVWSPSFLTVLLDTLARHADRLLDDLRDGARAAELRRDLSPARIWPRLRTISCWADGAASALLPAVSAAFPGVEIQPKGLLATEGVVTIPLTGREGGALALT